MAEANRVLALRRLAATVKKSGCEPLQICTDLIRRRNSPSPIHQFIDQVPDEERHYWIASLYALLMPSEQRHKLSAYFTPPHLAAHAVYMLKTHGFVLGQSRVLDPASGGAAFLVPLANEIATELRSQGKNARQIIAAVSKTIAGIEIDPELARLSKLMIFDLLRPELARTQKKLSLSIKERDSLHAKTKPVFDAVIVNPPYGRIFKPDDDLVEDYAEVISLGHVNRYALFIRQAVKWSKPGGVICAIVPMSFLGGPYFSELRRFILAHCHILSLDPIEQRSELFLDVLCDVCVLTLRKSGTVLKIPAPTSSLLRFPLAPKSLGKLDIPDEISGRIWALPNKDHSDSFFEAGYSRLSDYGYAVRTGYFVWNREQDRYRTGKHPRLKEVPLYWAHNIKANKVSYPAVDDQLNVGLAAIGRESPAVIRTDAILVQRTSNSRQKRRLVAGVIRQRSVPGSAGFVSENHTLLIVPEKGKKQVVDLATLCRLINSDAVDSRFRQISGTVSVSVRALRELPLPLAGHTTASFGNYTDDEAALKAYAKTAMQLRMNQPAGTESK